MAELLVRDPQQEKAQKLRLMLARITVKLNRKLPLTPVEENLLAECWRVQYLKPTETVRFDADGRIHFVKSQDVEPIMDAMKDYKDVIGRERNKNGAKLVGSIDTLTAANWARESKTKIGTKEFAQYAKKKLQDRDFRRFAAGGV